MTPGSPLAKFLAKLGIVEDDLLPEADTGVSGRLAPNGAIVRVGLFGGSEIVPPPADKRGAELRLLYWQSLLDHAEEAFRGLRQALTDPRTTYTWDARRFGPASGDGVADLKRLQELVLGFRKVVEQKKLLLECEPEVLRKRERERSDREQADKATAARLRIAVEVREITI
jgi:hypothetical protein